VEFVRVIVAAVFVMLGGVAAQATTPAGTTINNSATATYVDATLPGAPLSTTSNIVTITVAEISGITVVPQTPVGASGGVPTGGVIVPGGQVDFDFTVRNVGNNPDGFSIPNSAIIGGTAGATLVGPLQISYDGITFFPFTSASAGTLVAGRLTTPAGTPIPVNGTVVIRVIALVPAGAGQSSTITAQIGDTGPNDNSAATQNQLFTPPGNANDIFTTNGPAQPAPGPPKNGQREAAALASTTVQARPEAFAQILKAGALLVGNINPQLSTVPYGLTLNVLAAYPSAGPAYIAAPLAAANMQLDGATASRVLVSDVIPVNSVLTSVGAAPSGWTLVYSTDTTNVGNAAAFTSTAPPSLITVKRVGWVAPGPIPLGASVTGFAFVVTASGVPNNAPSTLLNVAQVFGTSQGDLTHVPIYDSSGDQYPSNFSAGNGTPGSSIPLATPPTNGVAPSSGPNDPGNNAGIAGGDNNVVPLQPQTSLLNGPQGAAPALGPDGTTTTDVTMQSVTVPQGLAPASGLPTPLQSTFTNTVGNEGTVVLTNVTLVPQTPGTPNALPDGTTVSLAWPGQPLPALYTFTNAAGWVLTSGTPISIPTIGTSGAQNYTVIITLPAGTAQSTNGGTAANGFPVPILASSTTGAFGTSSNLTTDTVFTGFVKLMKTAQVFNADGSPCDLVPSAAPNPSCVIAGNFVVYAINYSNIIPAVSGGSLAPSALRMSLAEDGQAAPNTFATLFSGVVATSHVQGSASDTTSGNTITYFNAAGQNVGDIVGTGTATGDVTKYIDTFAAPLAPGKSGSFTFKRKIN
jgi:hypothetical protein